LNEKIQKAKIGLKKLDEENRHLRESNDNHVYINEQLGKALKKAKE